MSDPHAHMLGWIDWKACDSCACGRDDTGCKYSKQEISDNLVLLDDIDAVGCDLYEEAKR